MWFQTCSSSFIEPHWNYLHMLENLFLSMIKHAMSRVRQSKTIIDKKFNVVKMIKYPHVFIRIFNFSWPEPNAFLIKMHFFFKEPPLWLSGKVFASNMGDKGSIPSRHIRKSLKRLMLAVQPSIRQQVRTSRVLSDRWPL